MNLTQGFNDNCKQKTTQYWDATRQAQQTIYGNGHGSNGTPPCGKSHCNPYQNDTKRTGIQTSGKSH